MGEQQNVIRHPDHSGPCDWCGTQRKVLYRYEGFKGLFCNQKCWLAFHDMTRDDFDYIEMRRV